MCVACAFFLFFLCRRKQNFNEIAQKMFHFWLSLCKHATTKKLYWAIRLRFILIVRWRANLSCHKCNMSLISLLRSIIETLIVLSSCRFSRKISSGKISSCLFLGFVRVEGFWFRIFGYKTDSYSKISKIKTFKKQELCWNWKILRGIFVKVDQVDVHGYATVFNVPFMNFGYS